MSKEVRQEDGPWMRDGSGYSRAKPDGGGRIKRAQGESADDVGSFHCSSVLRTLARHGSSEGVRRDKGRNGY